MAYKFCRVEEAEDLMCMHLSDTNIVTNFVLDNIQQHDRVLDTILMASYSFRKLILIPFILYTVSESSLYHMFELYD